MTEPFFNEIRKHPEFQAELVVALEEELAAMMKEMEAKDAEIERLKRVIAGLWHMAVNGDDEGFKQLVKETLGELP